MRPWKQTGKPTIIPDLIHTFHGGPVSESLNETTLRALAHLSGLELQDDDLKTMLPQFDSILTLIDRLQQVDTHGVAPLAQAFDLGVRLRDDEVTSHDGRERLAPLAPEMDEGLYLVPNVME